MLAFTSALALLSLYVPDAFAQTPPPPPPGTTIYSALQHFETSYPGIYGFLRGFCWIAGFVTALWSIFKLRNVSEMRGYDANHNMRSALVGWFVAVVLISLPFFGGVFANTLLLTDTNPFDYETGLQEKTTAVLAPVVHFVNLVGFVAMIYGVLLWKRTGRYGNQDRTMQRGFVFFASGVMAMNIIMVLKIVSATFGFKIMESIITSGFG